MTQADVVPGTDKNTHGAFPAPTRLASRPGFTNAILMPGLALPKRRARCRVCSMTPWPAGEASGVSHAPLTAEQLSYLLSGATGISRRHGGYDFRTAPSAGALYPIETYLSVQNVEQIAPGLYHYAITDHALELLFEGDHSAAVARAALDQDMCARAAAVFIWTAIFERSKWKYGQRAYRYIYLDAGHIAENLALAAAGLNLAACHVAAFYDDEVSALLNLDGKTESTIYMTAVGVGA